MTTEPIAALFEQLTGLAPEVALVGLALTLARVAPVATMAPFFAIPSHARGAWMARATMALVLSAALSPLALSTLPTLTAEALGAPVPLALTLLGEATVGAVFGLAVGLPLHALGWTGRLLDSWRGAALASSTDSTGDSSSPLGALMLAFGLALFFALGAHRLALLALADAWQLAPAATPVAWRSIALGAARLVGDALALAVAVAAPAATALVLVELAVGLVGRSAPQVPVFFAAMPLRAAAGLAALLLTLSATASLAPREFAAYVRAATHLLGG